MPRLAILSYSNGSFDARARRIAHSAAADGFEPVIYARWEQGQPLEEVVDGVRIVRVPTDLGMAIPAVRGRARRRVARIRATVVTPQRGVPGGSRAGRAASVRRDPVVSVKGAAVKGFAAARRAVRRLVVHARAWLPVRMLGSVVLFPLRPMAWAAALQEAAEPADLWHGMWAGSLPALAALKARHGGRTVYDSRDIYTHARVFDQMPARLRRWFLGLEQRWARDADAVVTVNDAYADILGPLLGVERPLVVRNCPAPYDPAGGRPDRLRAAVGLPPSTAVVLYQGGLLTDRGIEQAMDAILDVPDAHLVLLGYGPQRDAYAAAAERRYCGRVTLLPAVPPEELLEWTASADVMVMAIQPTSLNHQLTTPQKLWESIAAGVPVVAADLPGMAAVVREVGCGVLCDPTDPASIAAAISEILALPPADREAMRERTLAAARMTYNWDAQAGVLLAAYRRLAEGIVAR